MMQDEVTNIKILIVEDESIIAEDIKDCLENLGYCVSAIVVSGEEAIKKAKEIHLDLVLMDIRLKGNVDGVQAAEEIWNSSQIPVIYTTGHSDRNTMERVKATGPYGYILKPFEEKDLYVAIETALQRFKLEMQSKQREQWLDSILKNIGDAVIVTDVNSHIKLLNSVAEALTGWKQEEAIGRDLQEVFKIVNEETRTLATSPVKEALEEGAIVYLSEQINLISKNGIELPINDSAAPLKNHNGEITGAVLVFRNSSAKQTEQNLALLKQAKQLETQRAELQRLNQLKEEFFSTIAHELQTPIANIKTALQMLELILDQQNVFSSKLNQAPTQTIRYFQILQDQCEQELSLINDVLDLQRLDADANTLDLTTILLQHWLPGVVETFEERIQYNKQNLQVNISPNLPPFLSDLLGLKRIMTELLNNACKYTPPGEQITVTADAEKSMIQLRVSNSGVEIPTDQLPHIFEKFYRIPNSDFSNRSGTGLGLALVKKLVERLGGQISVNSQNSQTTFTVIFFLG